GHEEVANIAYLPGGERIVTCSPDKTVRIWDVENGEQEGATMEHEDWVEGLAVTRDGKRILSGGKSKRIMVWDVETHELIEEWEDETGSILCIAVSPDDQLAASGNHEGKIVIREMESGWIRHSIKAGGGVPSLYFSPNGEKLACAAGYYFGRPGVIHVYDVESGELPLMTMSGHEDNIQQIVYLPGGERIVTCSLDKTVRIWDVETGEQEGTTMEHEGLVHGLAVTRDGKRILSDGDDRRIMVWDVETHELIEEWEDETGGIVCIAMSPDDQFAAGGDLRGKIVIREIEESGRIRLSIKAGGRVHSLCFSPNGEKLACAAGYYYGEPGVIHVYDVESGELVFGPIKAHEDVIECVLWSLDGSQLFSASWDGTIRCWNSDTGESIGEPWKGHTGSVYSLSLSPDGTKLASASEDQTVRFWDARSGDPIDQPLQHDHVVFVVTFSPSGEFVASGGVDKKVSIWRVP
ncbi:hypothetical protein PAXINDRAFT_29092, partial [Paxillus involutus ATCC 200175]